MALREIGRVVGLGARLGALVAVLAIFSVKLFSHRRIEVGVRSSIRGFFIHVSNSI
jgi:hypothetical protein